jgi:hypothetical protein
MLTHIHLSWLWFTCGTIPKFNDSVYPGPEPLCPQQALPLVLWRLAHIRGHCPSFMALTGSCARHQNPLIVSIVLLINESLQVVTSPCWELVLPSVISANLSPDDGPLQSVKSPILRPVSLQVEILPQRLFDVGFLISAHQFYDKKACSSNRNAISLKQRCLGKLWMC